MKYLTNAFSIQMLSGDSRVAFSKISLESAKEALSAGWISAIGHEDTANVLSTMLGMPIAMNRVSVSLGSNDELIVAQVIGGRLPEGATTLPEGVQINFWHVTLQ